jgi:hypothetical protein
MGTFGECAYLDNDRALPLLTIGPRGYIAAPADRVG